MSRDEDTSGLFRQVNEQIQKLSTTFGLTNGERLQIICECAQTGCAEPIDLTMDEYGHVRAVPGAVRDEAESFVPPGGPSRVRECPLLGRYRPAHRAERDRRLS